MATPHTKHPFLDDLALDAELSASVLRYPVKGRENIKRLVEAVGKLYSSQTPTFFGDVGGQAVARYNAVLQNGIELQAVAAIDRANDGTVSRVSVTFAPLDAVISMSAQLGTALGAEFDRKLFM